MKLFMTGGHCNHLNDIYANFWTLVKFQCIAFVQFMFLFLVKANFQLAVVVGCFWFYGNGFMASSPYNARLLRFRVCICALCAPRASDAERIRMRINHIEANSWVHWNPLVIFRCLCRGMCVFEGSFENIMNIMCEKLPTVIYYSEMLH